MAEPWAPERAVSAEEARALIESQHPALAPATVEPFGVGWDNTAFLVNAAFVFRFPRRTLAVSLLEVEIAALPSLSPRLPLPVPVPVLVGRPEGSYPWPFAGYRLLRGRTACRAALDDAARIAAAEPLARFLRALHAVPVEIAQDWGVPADTIGRLDPGTRVPMVRERMEELRRRGRIEDVAAWDAVIAGATPPRGEALVHGDLYSRHVLVDEAGQPCGLIDWGDLHVGDPAVDLGLAHAFLPPAAHEAFRRAYGPIDDDVWLRARFRALFHSVAIAWYGDDIGDPDLLREGLTGLGYLRER